MKRATKRKFCTFLCMIAAALCLPAMAGAGGYVRADAAGTALTDSIAAYSGKTAFSVFLMEDGTVYSMGDNTFAQLGNGRAAETPQYYADKVEYLGNIAAVRTGNYHTLALGKGGEAYAWGNNAYGQLGVKDQETVLRYRDRNEYVAERDLSYPAGVFAEGAESFRAVSAGGSFSVLLDSEGGVWTCGTNANGQLGAGMEISADSFASTLVRVKGVGGEGYLENIVQIRATENSAIALDADGYVYAWGSNYYGCLGEGRQVSNSAVPVAVQTEGGTPLGNIASIDACDKNAMALSKDGTVYVWGSNMFGQRGDGTYELTERITRAVRVSYFEENGISPSEIHCGSNICFVSDGEGRMYGWGMCVDGSLGMGSYDNFPDSVKVKGEDGSVLSKNEVVFPYLLSFGEEGESASVKQFLGSDYRTFFRDEGGRTWSFGNNTYGQAGYAGEEEGVPRAAPAQLRFEPVYDGTDYEEPNYLIKPVVVICVTIAVVTALFVRAAIKKRKITE